MTLHLQAALFSLSCLYCAASISDGNLDLATLQALDHSPESTAYINLQDKQINNFKKLVYLTLNNNQITSIELGTFTGLASLSLCTPQLSMASHL